MNIETGVGAISSQAVRRKRYLSSLRLAMFNVVAVISLRGLPMMAATGSVMFFYLLFASLLFLIPSALMSTELTTNWFQTGGVYLWVKIAFGSQWGFVAIWPQWIQNVIWYLSVLAFVTSTLAYLFEKPMLASNNTYDAFVIIVIYWLSTFTTFKGLQLAEKIVAASAACGILFPALLMIPIGFYWILTGHHPAFMTSHETFFPSLSHIDNMAWLYLIIQNVNTAFFLLSAMTVTPYLVMHIIMFVAVIRLRYTQPNVPRAYKIPGDNWDMWIVAGSCAKKAG